MAASSNIPTDEEFEKMKKSEIVDFLRSRNKRRSGNKPELLAFAKNVAREAKNDIASDVLVEATVLMDLVEKRKIFEKEELLWQNIDILKSSDIPGAFGSIKINDFLTKMTISLEDEDVEVSVQQHAKKGKRLYVANKIQFCEVSLTDEHLLFRANIAASMKTNLFR